jgi:iron complex transport system substrate-binding protein
MRIVSLLPSATEIICALGLRDQLVGISHRCDYPPELEGLTVVTRPGPSAAAAAPTVADEIGPAVLDVTALVSCQPDLIVCRDTGPAPHSIKVRDALEGRIDPQIIALDPVSLEGIFHAITTIGAMVEMEDDAIELLEALREDLGEIEQHAVVRHDEGIARPRVVVLKGFDPPIAGGFWVPEQVRRAGGWELLGAEGEAPRPTTWEAVRDVDPDMLLMAPAGMTLANAQAAWTRIEKPEFWHDIAAVRRGHVFIVDPDLLCRPGPRVVDGVAMLAEIFDPDGFIETSPPASWTPLFE